jgi:hypothetical protein
MELFDEIKQAALNALINKNVQELQTAISGCTKIAYVYSEGLISTGLVMDSWFSLPRWEEVKLDGGKEKVMMIILLNSDKDYNKDDEEILQIYTNLNSSFPAISKIEYHEPTKELLQEFLKHYPDFNGRDARDIKYIKEIHDLYLTNKIYTLY